MERVSDCDGDIWEKEADGLFHFGDLTPKTLSRLEERWGPLTHLDSVTSSYTEVFIVASKDWDYNTTVLLTTSVEDIATDLVSVLKLADSGSYYTYSVERKAVVR